MRKTNKYFFSSYDSLTIYDGGSSTSVMIGKYCGNSIPPSLVSSSNEVLIKFQSDGSWTESGFKMEYNPLGNTHQFKITILWGLLIYYRELWEYSSFLVLLTTLTMTWWCRGNVIVSCTKVLALTPGPILALFFSL